MRRTLALLLVLGAALPVRAQKPAEPRAEVELPLTVYDQLRAAAKERKDPPPKAAPFAGTRTVRASLSVDLEKRRAAWDAELEAQAGGEEVPAVPLLLGAAPVSRWAVVPETARIDSSGAGTRLVPEAPGLWRVTLAGEIGGQGDDETFGIRYPLPRLAGLPAALDVTLPAGSLASVEGGTVTLTKGTRPGWLTGRITVDPDRAAVLVVKRAGRTASGPPSVSGSLHVVSRISEDAVRRELRLSLAVRKGLLETKSLRLPGASLVAASGPVVVTAEADGVFTLRFEPPVSERSGVAVSLTLLSAREPGGAGAPAPGATEWSAAFPSLPLGPDERLEKRLTVIAEGGLLLEARDEADWERVDAADSGAGADDIALSWKSRIEAPRPLALSLKRLRSLAVASALARVSLQVFVGDSGETRTRLVTDVRSRGRSSLRFRIPAGTTVLAARADGAPVAVSQPAPDRVEVPIGADTGRTRIELLLSGRVAPPAPGQKLTLPSAGPEEAVERVGWSVTLPAGLKVKEEGRRVPAPPEPAAPSRPTPELSPGDRTALEASSRLAAADRESGREGAWSPRTDLPVAPLAYASDFLDVGEEIPPLLLTLATAKEDDPWY